MRNIILISIIIVIFANTACSKEKVQSVDSTLSLLDRISNCFTSKPTIKEPDINAVACQKFEGDWELYENYQIYPLIDDKNATEKAIATKVIWKPYCITKNEEVFLSGIDVTEHTIKINDAKVALSANSTSIDINFEEGKPKSRAIGTMLSFTIEPSKDIMEQLINNSKTISVENKEINKELFIKEINEYKNYINEKKRIGTAKDRQCSISTDSIDGKIALKATCNGYTKTLIKNNIK